MLKEKHGILTYIVSVNGWLVLTHDSFKKKKRPHVWYVRSARYDIWQIITQQVFLQPLLLLARQLLLLVQPLLLTCANGVCESS